MKDLAARAREGKLQPHEYQGGTASLSNLGMFGIRQFDAVINPPQAMIMAAGAGDRRPVIMGDEVKIATIMTATGSFDHRAIDGADAAQLMQALKEIIERPLMLAALSKPAPASVPTPALARQQDSWAHNGSF